jgi:sugar phosphate isomerase/epimerase
MLNRREFGLLSLVTLATLATGRMSAATKTPLGVQLYTVRSLAEKDLSGVLKAIRDIGYEEVEPYWNIYNHPATELKKIIGDHGLRVPSGHFDYEGLESKFDYAQELGVQYMICPILPETLWNSLDAYKKVADQFNEWGAEANRRGMRFGFHNHNYEFKPFGDTNGYDTLLSRTDPKLVMFEMDCYWIAQSGQNPVKFMDEHADRIHLLHLKDRKAGFPVSQWKDKGAEHFTEVGSGTLDWKAILAAAEKNKIQHMFVEQDEPEIPPIESLRKSFSYLQKLL